jgi:hypothetical protein
MAKYFILLFLLASCYSVKIANKQLNKAQEIYPKATAKKCALWYPCEPFKSVSDSSQYKLWINQVDSLNELKIDTLIKFDTVVKYSLITDCQKLVIKYRDIIRKYPVIHDTIYKIDNAKLISITIERDKALVDRTKYEVKYKVFLKISFWLLLFLILFIAYVIKRKLY